MSLQRVFHDQDGVVLAIHPLEQGVLPSAYAAEGREVRSIVTEATDMPSVMEDVCEPVLDEAGAPILRPDGVPLLRSVGQRPRRLSEEWLSSYVAPLQETIDSTQGKLALLDADKLDAVTDAVDAIADPKERMAAKLKLNAPTWSRSDPVWAKLGKAAKLTPKAWDDVWRAAVAG